jgi:uncharacterized membrane protein YeaQ/YmgE (transglycosylase-associated protein family)
MLPRMTGSTSCSTLLIAAIAGGIGRAIAGGTRGGCIVSIVLGFIGAMLGSWLARELKLPGGVRHPPRRRAAVPFLWAVIGAALFVAVVVLLSGGTGVGSDGRRRPRARRVTERSRRIPG